MALPMNSDWWEANWFWAIIAWLIGIPTGLLVNFLSENMKKRKEQEGDYFSASISGDYIQFEGRIPNDTLSIASVQQVIQTILGDKVVVQKPIGASPKSGAVGVDVNPTFSWPIINGGASYEFEIAEEIGQSDKFNLKDEVGSSTTNAYKLVKTIKNDAKYWWRVRAVNNVGAKSAWNTYFFTTTKQLNNP
jgi:hypothetical protein